MKNLSFKWLLMPLVLITFSVGNAQAVTINFGSTEGYWDAHTDGNFTDSDSRSWSRTYSAGGKHSGGTDYAQFGNSSNTCTSLVLTATAGSAITLTSFSVSMEGSSASTAGTIYLYKRTSGGTETQLGTATVSGTTSSTCSMSSNTSFAATDILKVSYVGTAKAIRITTMSYTYTTGGGTTYTVSYAAGTGGSGTNPGAHTGVSSGSSITLKANTFTAPTGKQFAGWNDGSNTYAAGASYTVTGNKTMTAQWECIEPTISGQPASANYTVGDSPSGLSVTASLSSGTMTYLWKVSTNGGSTWSNASGTNNAATYAAANISTAAAGTTKYKCIVTNSTASCSTESDVATITVSAPATPATVTLENYSGSDPTGLHVGDSYTLPSSNSFSCGTKTFVGWSSVEINTPGSKPVSNYWDKGASVTISSASMTFYAVFADESGGGVGDPTTKFSVTLNVSSISAPTGYTVSHATEWKNSTHRQDGSNDPAYVKIYHTSTKLFSSLPSTITIKAELYGGSSRDMTSDGSDYYPYVFFTDNSGSEIAGSAKAICTSVTASAAEKSVNMTVSDATNAYGIGIRHKKISSFNLRYSSITLEYATATPPTYSNYTTSCTVAPTATFSNGTYTIGGSALDLQTLWESESSGAVTYSITNANGTGATLAGDGYSLSATTAGSCTVQASQAAAGIYTAITKTATITVQNPTCATPTFNNGTNTYNNDVTVTISCATDGSTIHYTTNGTDPTCSSGSTGTSATISATGTTLKAVACKTNYDVSAVASATYTLKCATPTISVAAGTYSSAQSVTLACTTDGATIKYTTDGRDPATYGTTYSSAITISDDATLKVIATKTNYVNSDLASAAYVIKDCDWYESFDNCDGAGGNSGNWSGYSNMGTPVYDHDGWTVNAGAGKGDKCIKAGTSGTRGTAQTPSITVDNATTYKLSFRMAPWNSTTTTASFTLSGGEISSGVSTWTSASNMSDGEWNDYQVSITTTSTSLQITFTTGSGENRFWLDEVCLKGPSSYTVTFNANGHGTAPDPITDIAKNATISKPTPDPSATGWTFGGWYKEPACTNAWTWATDQVTSNTTLYAKWTCSNPTSLSISSTGSKYDFCAGESMTLTVSGSDIASDATYQWSLGGSPIDGATSASYTTTMAAAKAGEYTCTVSNGSCSQTTSGFWVRVWQLYIDNGAAGAWQALDFTNTGTGTGNNTTVALDADGTYHFKLKDNTGGFFGLNSKTVTGTESNITLNGTGANVNVTSGLEGNYTFAINYSNKNNPTIAITYPTANQAANYDIWFDKSVVTGWNDAGTSDLYYRIGKSTNHTNNTKTGGTAWTLVPGTDKFYTTKTMAYDGFEAWAISNNAAWCDNSDDNHSIYGNATDSYKITKAIDFQKYVVGSSGVTIVPTSSHNTDGNGCNYWYVTKTDGMLTHTATITTPSHGTITISNTDQSLSETTTTADLPHRTILTVTATPDAGYNLTSLTVNAAAFTSGNTHILAADATIAATFTAKVITVTWNVNGGNTLVPGTSSYTYDGDALVLPTPTKDGKVFVGWYTLAEGGDEVTNVGGANKPTADVEYFAHWSDGNRVVFHPGAGTVSPDVVTQATVGGSVTLSTPTPTCDGWTFQGWKVGSAQTDVTELPDGLLAGGSSYVPASATVDMYAVYKKTFDETAPQSVTVDWEASSGYLTGWSTTGSWSRVTRSTNHAGLVAASATLKYSTKVKVKSVSAKFMRESNNTAGAFMFEKSTDGVNWSDVDTDNWHTPDEATKNEWFSFGYAQKDGFFDGTTEYYIRLNFTTSGSADRLFDDITITYNATSSVTHYATSPLECAQVATPVITPEGDNYTGAQSITITCATDGATIRYTTDGTDPSSSVGTVIASGSTFTLSCSGTVKAIAYKDGMADSDIASETYTLKTPNPTFSPDGGNFKVAQSVSISDALAGTTVYYEYTTDGSEPSDPTSSSTAYSSTPISVAVGQTVRIKAIGINACCANSDIVSKTFRVGWDFELVTTEDDLNAGDKIVILNGTTNALSTYNEAGNNRTSSSDFDISGTTVTAYPPSTNSATTVQVITLDGGPGDWKLKTTDTKWFNCPSAGKLTTVTTDGSGAEDLARRRWSIDIGSSPNYYATIQNNQETTATIQYGTVFAAYATDQYPVKIYSLPNPDPVLKVEGTLSAFAGCTSAASAAQSFYVSGKNLSASIRVTAPTGYEVSLSSGSGYADYIDVARVGTAVAKTQVYVRLKAGDAGAVAANNVAVSVEANSLSQNVAIPASAIYAADTYVDRMHGNSTTYECGSYSAPNLSDDPGSTGTDCQKTYLTFQGWVAASDVNLDGTLKAGATVISSGASKTANGTTYYSIWGEDEP